MLHLHNRHVASASLVSVKERFSVVPILQILSPHLPDGSPNRLKEEIGTSKLEMLLDILVHPEGPKLRAKISHGEVSAMPEGAACQLQMEITSSGIG